MTIKLDNVSCLLHLPIIRRLLDYSRTSRPEVLNLVMTYLGADPRKSQHEIDDTRGYHVRYPFMTKLYEDHLGPTMDVVDDYARTWTKPYM